MSRVPYPPIALALSAVLATAVSAPLVAQPNRNGPIAAPGSATSNTVNSRTDSMRYHLTSAALFAVSLAPVPPQSGKNQPPVYPSPPAYADAAGFAVKAPMVIDGTIRDAVKIKAAEAVNVRPGFVRYYLTIDVIALIRAPGALPPRLGYVYDVAIDSAGRTPKFKKSRVLLFARPVSGMADQIQLVDPNAQIGWSPAADSMARGLAAAVASPDAPPAITGISNAFHAAGVLPGEGETQIFLKTTGHPISLGIQRKQDQPPVWTVSLSEVVEDALPPPKRDTFLWYRLACGLPRELPPETLAGLEPDDAAAIRADYALVKQGLGPCRRPNAGGGPS